ncbi:MAG: hypothetical protein K2H43_04540, partial [Clostridia bacterium]|nr:hypothetical protein [Clostridia bacterium]
STNAQNLLREEYLYVRTLSVVKGWYTKIGWELPHFGWTAETGVFSNDMDYDASNGWFFKTDGDYVLTDELFAKIPEAEIAELAALWSEAFTPMNDTYALRLNAYVIDELLRGEGHGSDANYKIMALFYAVLDYDADDAYAFDRKPANPEEGVSYTRRVISPMGAVITAAKGLEGAYVDENTVAGICDFDGASYVLPLKALWDNLNEAQRAALKNIPGTKHVEWAITNYYGEYDKMNSVKEKALALDTTAADFETKLAEVVEIFNTLYNSSSYFFRDSNSQWAPNDGTFVKGSYEEAWTKLSTVMEGHYKLDGYYLVPVTADAE